MYIFKRHNPGLIFAILLLTMAVVACRGETPASPSTPASSPIPTPPGKSILQPTPSPKNTSEPSRVSTPQPETSCPSCGSIEEQAREALADWLGISSEEIEIVEVEEVEWPDASLGCPQPGMVYAQVITPGLRVMMRVKDEVYEYHSGGGHGVLCDREGHLITAPPSPTVTPITVPSAPTPTIEDVCPMLPVFPHGRLCPTPSMPGH